MSALPAEDDDDEIVRAFLVESHEGLDELDRDLVELERTPDSRDVLSRVFRTIHTVKGASGFLAFGRLERLTHCGENVLSRLRDGELTLTSPTADALLAMVDTVRALLADIEATGADADPAVDVDRVVAQLEAATTAPVDEPVPAPVTAPVAAPVEPASAPASQPDSVRVDVDLLDTLVGLVGELVLTRNQIVRHADAQTDQELVRASQRLNLVVSELQEGVMRTRMQPIGQAWTKFPRVVRDLAAQLGKQVRLEMTGQETELDRSLLEAVKDPLTHLVRNAIDHGIEAPADRLAAGKPESGLLALRAYHESGQVVVEISDDGKGLDPGRIGAVAIERGVVTSDQLARMGEREVAELIFRPGFSTAATVTNVSGRGVGMDVVRTNIERIGGVVDLAGRTGAGTTVRVRIPLTLAIIPALLVGAADERFAVPQPNLVELVRLETADAARAVETLAGAPVLRLRGRLLPLVSLTGQLGLPERAADAMTVVVVQADELRFGLVVDEVHDTQEIVVKPLGRQLKPIAMYAGATIMGDGRVALILDVGGLARSAGVSAGPAGRVEDAGPAGATESTSLLVLDVGDDRRAALPLAAVSRLEEFGTEHFERSGDVEVVRYRDGILPLVRLAASIGLPPGSHEHDTVSVVVHDDGAERVGLVADGVVDVVDMVVAPSAVGTRPGVLGTAIVLDRVTDLVDLPAVVGGVR